MLSLASEGVRSHILSPRVRCRMPEICVSKRDIRVDECDIYEGLEDNQDKLNWANVGANW